MTRNELAQRIFEISSLRGEFRLRSGRTSDNYFDKYLFEGQPDLLRAIAEAMAPMIPSETQALAGLELGGVPIATVLSQITGIPTIFVRKSRKEYGTCKLAEGGEILGRRLTIIEDVVTTGGQILESARERRKSGAIVDDVLCVIDRESGGPEKLAAGGLRLNPLYSMSELQERHAIQ